MADRWDESEIVEAQVGQSRCGLKRLADSFPGLTDEEKELASNDVTERRRPLFVYCSEGLSERTHGFLFMIERGAVRCSQRRWGKARDLIRLTPAATGLKFPPQRAPRS
jgi:hypothetical protein